MNIVTLIGRLTRDPELRYSKDSNAYCRFTIAENGRNDETNFINIVTFGKTAENCAKYLAKGSQVGIVGRIKTGNYKHKDGYTVYTTDIIAQNVEFLSKAKGVEHEETKRKENKKVEKSTVDKNDFVPYSDGDEYIATTEDDYSDYSYIDEEMDMF